MKTDFLPTDEDRKAAWKIFIFMLTTIATQSLPDDQGIEESALQSLYKLFKYTRIILLKKGRKAHTFSSLAINMLNRTLRPFTVKWHKLSSSFTNDAICKDFRKELRDLQKNLKIYARAFAELADCENLIEVQNAKSIEDIVR